MSLNTAGLHGFCQRSFWLLHRHILSGRRPGTLHPDSGQRAGLQRSCVFPGILDQQGRHSSRGGVGAAQIRQPHPRHASTSSESSRVQPRSRRPPVCKIEQSAMPLLAPQGPCHRRHDIYHGLGKSYTAAQPHRWHCVGGRLGQVVHCCIRRARLLWRSVCRHAGLPVGSGSAWCWDCHHAGVFRAGNGRSKLLADRRCTTARPPCNLGWKSQASSPRLHALTQGCLSGLWSRRRRRGADKILYRSRTAGRRMKSRRVALHDEQEEQKTSGVVAALDRAEKDYVGKGG